MRRTGHRILMTTDAVGGVWTYACELTRALCESGHRVQLVTMGPAPRTDQIEPLRRLKDLQIRVTDLALEWLDPEGADIERAHDRLLQIAKGFRPDIVHLNSFREGGFDWPAPVLAVAHSCVGTWWQACRGCAPDEERWRVYSKNVAIGLEAADIWAAPTAAFRDDITSRYRPSAPGRVIRNGLTIGPALSAGQKQPFILAAGRLWDEAKNLKTLLACAPALPWPLQVAGPAEPPETNSGISSLAHIRRLGALPHAALIGHMQRASVFVSPALYEPFGLTVLEAAACGCALVLADLPSFRELWNDAAVFVAPRDAGALTTALQRVCRDENLRRRLQTVARQRARRYSRGAMLRAYQRLYQDMIIQADRPRLRSNSLPELRA